ncbi:MAG: hypothetical protein IPK17_05060 [Chloroflexi bacterium]|nr:hypothetical protein [Chloroflexota bacterium]
METSPERVRDELKRMLTPPLSPSVTCA